MSLAEVKQIESARNGDRAALARLLEEHHERVQTLAFRLTGGDRESAEEIAQEAFLRILKTRTPFRGTSSFTTYLYRIIINLVAERGRRASRRREVSTSPAVLPELSAGDRAAAGVSASASDGPFGEQCGSRRPDQVRESRELARQVGVVLAALPREQREVFVLSELEGLRYREIAEICGCPEGTVASRKHQAVQAFRRELREWGKAP